ncbi:signal peptidase II [bacterium]|jgi:signal peptidase II|nr:signal peptidase II [bacterium]MBT5014914.1 signal peptidase II [bacterium]
MNWSWCNTLVLIIPFVADRVSKWWALTNLDYTSMDIGPNLRFELMFNRGISWGMFNSSSTLVFALVNLAIISAIIFLIWMTYVFMQKGKSITGLLLILSGALSNVLDRVVYHGVIDFIVVHYNNWYWPTFNIADVAIEFGAVWLIIQGLYTSWD